VECPGTRNLGGTKAAHKISPPHLTRIVHRLECGIDRAEPTGEMLRGNGLAGEHAVSGQKLSRHRCHARGGGDGAAPRRGGECPPAFGRTRHQSSGTERARLATAFAGPFHSSAQGVERVIGEVTGPDEVPECIHEIAGEPAAQSRVDISKKRSAVFGDPRQRLGLKGDESIAIGGLDDKSLTPRQTLTLTAKRADDRPSEKTVTLAV